MAEPEDSTVRSTVDAKVDEVHCPACGEAIGPRDMYCESCGMRLPVDGDRVEYDLGEIAAGISDIGHHHRRNEDAFVLRNVPAEGDYPGAVIAVVCDGVSTSGTPERASQLAAHTAAEVLAAGLRSGADAAEALTDAVAAAGKAVVGLVSTGTDETVDADLAANAPACTLVSAVVTPERVTVGWLGDSRAYWLAENAEPGRSDFLTTDDSWAVEMIRAGELTAEQALADPRSHALTRWLGADADQAESAPHLTELRPSGPGAVLLCSDGLWNYRAEPDALAIAAMPDAISAPFAAARTLVEYALQRGGQDNITVVVVPLPQVTTRRA